MSRMAGSRSGLYMYNSALDHRPIFMKAGAMIRVAHISDVHLVERKAPSPFGTLEGMFPV